jgi:capsular polysaccharide export protein
MVAPGIVNEHVKPIVLLLENEFEITAVAYWKVKYDLFHEIYGLPVTFLTISDDGFESIPRIEKKNYTYVCGHDINFAKVRIHDVIINDYPLSRNFIYHNSIEFQRLYGFAYRIENIIRSIKPDYIIVQQGSEPISKIIFSKGKKIGVPVLLGESSFFPHKILIDSSGMHFFPNLNKIDTDWQKIENRILGADRLKKVNKYLSEWKREKASKYTQPQNTLISQIRIEKIRNKKVIFIPGQVPDDANILNSLFIFKSFYELVSFVSNNLCNNWLILYKPHPKYREDHISCRSNLIVVDGNIHDLIDISDIVLTFSSNIGLEAIIYEKPVIVAGRPHYSGKGLTIDLQTKEDLRNALTRAQEFKYDNLKRLNFLYYIIFEYLIDINDKGRLLKRLREAKKDCYKWQPGFAPFTESIFGDPNNRASRWLNLVHMYNQLAKKNLYPAFTTS